MPTFPFERKYPWKFADLFGFYFFLRTTPTSGNLSKEWNSILCVWTWSPVRIVCEAKPMVWLYFLIASLFCISVRAILWPAGILFLAMTFSKEQFSFIFVKANHTLSFGCKRIVFTFRIFTRLTKMTALLVLWTYVYFAHGKWAKKFYGCRISPLKHFIEWVCMHFQRWRTYE